jgi:hypothetical protein
MHVGGRGGDSSMLRRYDVEEEGEDYLEGNHTVDHAGDLPNATGVLPMPSQKVPMGRTRMYNQVL